MFDIFQLLRKIDGLFISSHPPAHPSIRRTRALRALVGVGLSLDPEGRLKGGGGLISERILEIPLKINDIEKVNTLQFDKRNPFKTEQTKKIKN